MNSRDEATRPLRIGLDVRALHRSFRGSGHWRYVYNLVRALGQLRTPHEYSFFSPHRIDELDLPNFPEEFRHTFARFTIPTGIRRVWLWEQAFLPLFLRSLSLDVCHFLLQMATWIHPCRIVVTGYDTMREIFPEYAAIRGSRNYRFLKRAIRRADWVVAISESSRTDLVREYRIDPQRISVAPLGSDPVFRPMPRDAAQAAAAGIHLPQQFLLSVLSYEPRKNTIGAIKAFGEFVRATTHPHHLVLFGDRGAGLSNQIIERAVLESGVPDRIHLVGRVDDRVLAGLYNLADFFVFPSLYEGFGLPVLEAMACGKAVVAASVSSMPEIIGEAGVLIDVSDVALLAETMGRLTSDKDLLRRLEQRALEEAKRFSWEQTALRVLEVYEHVGQMP